MALTYQNSDPATMRATISAFFSIGSVMSLAALWLAGEIGVRQLQLTALILPGVVLGIVTARRVKDLPATRGGPPRGARDLHGRRRRTPGRDLHLTTPGTCARRHLSHATAVHRGSSSARIRWADSGPTALRCRRALTDRCPHPRLRSRHRRLRQRRRHRLQPRHRQPHRRPPRRRRDDGGPGRDRGTDHRTAPETTEAPLPELELIEPGPVRRRRPDDHDQRRHRSSADGRRVVPDRRRRRRPAASVHADPGVFYDVRPSLSSPIPRRSPRDRSRWSCTHMAAAGCATSPRTTPRRSPATATSSRRPITQATPRSTACSAPEPRAP